MAAQVNASSATKSDRLLSWSIFVFAVLGAVDSLYLLIYKLTGNNHMCLGNGGCHDVNFSPYSEIYGIPLSAIGLAAYILIALVVLLEPRIKLLRENGALLLFGMGLVGFAFSIYLTYLELYVIHAICPFCVASAVLITLIFIFALIRVIKQTVA